jgi:hypothetical protein
LKGNQTDSSVEGQEIPTPQDTLPDPLLALRGSGKELWADEHADEYVRRLREDWE